MSLADVYSYLESLRRGTKGLLANPADTLNQWGSQIKEDLGKYDQGNARTMGLLSDPILGGGSAPGASAWQNNGPLGMNAGLLGLHIAYHGTPHTVDKFDMSKVGTGEGAQAYGHGLYFAENPSTAQVYQRNLSAQKASRDANPLELASAQLLQGNVPQDSIVKALNRMQPNLTQDDIAKAISGGQRTLEAQKGNLYKVDINADPAHYLDWDKPLSEQSQHVQDAVSPLLTVNFAKSNPIGSEIYHGFGPSGYEPAGTATKDMATQALRQAGIPGIKYKDAGSRAADGGTHNYVVFDDSLINNLGPWQP